MKTTFIFFITFIQPLFWGCSAISQNAPLTSFEVNELLEQLPAENNTQRDLVIEALFSLNEQNLVAMGAMLESQDVTLQNRAQYAIHGMAVVAGGLGNELRIEKISAVIAKTLAQVSSLNSRIFLLEQLKILPDDIVVSIAAPYLADNALAETAVMVLQANNSPQAVTELTDALDNGAENLKPAIVIALSEMNKKDAADDIFALLPVKNHQLELSIFRSLAALGYQPAEKLLRNFIKQNKRQAGLLLLFAQSLANNGENVLSESIYREILKNESTLFNSAQRAAALNGLTVLLKEKAFKDIVLAYNDEDKKVRITALDAAKQFKNPENINKWIEICDGLPATQKIEIIDLLGGLQSPVALPFLREQLKDNNQLIQAIAIQSLNQILEKGIEQDVKLVLKTEMANALYRQTENILLQLGDSLALADVVKGFGSYSTSGKTLCTKLIATRRLAPFSYILIDQLDSDNDELKSAALDGIALFPMDIHFEEILNHYLASEDKQLLQKYRSALQVCYNSKLHSTFLIDHFEIVSDEEKVKLITLFRHLGGEKLFQKSLQFALGETGKYNDEAKTVLLKWNDESALPFLLNMARSESEEKKRTQAVHTAVSILKKEKMPQDRVVNYCAELLEADLRVQEKTLIVSVLSNIGSKPAMQLLIKKLNDPEIEYNVFLALLNAQKTGNAKNSDDSMTEALIINLIKGKISNTLDDQIEHYLIEKFKANPPEGFTALFNGLDLTGWKGIVANPIKRAQMTADELEAAQQKADSVMRACWSVIDGVLYFNGDGFPNICTIGDYADFELFLDWKIEDGGDSGIYLRGTPQVQIWDHITNAIGSGGLYNNTKNASLPLEVADRPIGEWNTFHIIMQGQRVTVYLNNKLVADNVILENYWDRKQEIFPSGQIELQAHMNPLYFKNIYIKELKSEPLLTNKPLFKGKDKDGWQVINNQENSWQVSDGILFCEGAGGGWLSTKEEYDNFELQLEFRLPEGGNSGVFIRTPLKGDPAYVGMEIQLLDDYADKYSALKAWQFTGSIYGLQAPKERASKKANQWQKMIITCQGPQVKVVLNDKEIINANLADFSFAEAEHPGIKRRKGFIGLQNHSTRVEFKSILLKELP